jgi:hypothetical protein
MNRADFDRFSLALTACAELHGKTVSEGALTLWWQSLQRFDIEQVLRAFSAVIQDPDGGQFMPKPADLIRRLDGSASDRSLIAWGRVHEAMARVGAYKSVDFGDRAIHAAITDLGGWPNLCRSTIDELPFTQKRFCDAYRAYTNRPDIEAPLRLAGQHETDNARLPNAPVQVVQIGGRTTQAPRIGGKAA